LNNGTLEEGRRGAIFDLQTWTSEKGNEKRLAGGGKKRGQKKERIRGLKEREGSSPLNSPQKKNFQKSKKNAERAGGGKARIRSEKRGEGGVVFVGSGQSRQTQ